MAALLHPQHKHAASETEITQLVEDIKNQGANSDFVSKRPKLTPRPHVLSTDDDFGDNDSVSLLEVSETVEEEVARYYRTPLSFQPSDSLADMWVKLAPMFPRIAKAARPFVIAQASSIASERFFGSAVRVDTRFRATMLPHLLLFARANIYHNGNQSQEL